MLIGRRAGESSFHLRGAMITVRACKYDGSEHRSWRALLVKKEGSLIVLDAEFDEEIRHDLLGTIAKGTNSLEYYWLDRWYNVFRFAEPDGQLRNFYCNINVPPDFSGQVLTYVDLDIDILVAPDRSYRILDRDDFERNAIRYGYSSAVRRNVTEALAELIDLIEARAFPFDS